MYQRDIPWENYLHRFGFKEDTSRGLQRFNLPQYQLAPSARLIAAEGELKSILDRSLYTLTVSVDPRTVTPEGLQSSFDWAMGSLLWKMELPRQNLLDQIGPLRNQGTQSIIDARRRVDTAYLNGSYSEALRAFQTLESVNYQDFSLYLTAGHIYLYHQKPVELEKARAAYLKAGICASPRAPLYAGRALLWAAFAAYLQHDDVSALEYSLRALQVTLQWGEAWYTLARISAAICQPDEALPALEQAIRADRVYALRAATDRDFSPIEEDVKSLFERLRLEARQQAETYGKSLTSEAAISALPTQDQVTSQRLQADISERWRQDSYFGYLDAAGKMMRFKLYVDGLRLPERDRLVTETNRVLAQLRTEINNDNYSPGLKDLFQNELQGVENSMAGVPTLSLAQVALNQANKVETLWKLASSQVVLAGHAAEVNLVAFDPSGQWLASGGPWEQSIRLWDIFSGETQATLAGHTDGVNALLFTPDGKIIISAGGHFKAEDFTIRLWEAPGGRAIEVLDGHQDMVTTLALNADGSLLASGSADATVGLWDVAERKQFAGLRGHQSNVTCLAINPDSSLLISGGEDQTIRLWDVASANQVGILLGHEAPIAAVYLMPDGKTLISYAGDGTIRMWDVVNHQLLSVHEQPGRITTLALSGDGTRLAWSMADDPAIRLWTPGDDQPPLVLTGHTNRVTTLAFSSDNQLLASGSESGILRLWDAASGKGRAIRGGHSDRINNLAFNPNGTMLASASRDKTVRLWGLILSNSDAEEIEAEEKARQEKEAREKQEALEKAERQRLEWIKDGRCEVCGQKIGFIDRLAKRTRCKEHRT